METLEKKVRSQHKETATNPDTLIKNKQSQKYIQKIENVEVQVSEE